MHNYYCTDLVRPWSFYKVSRTLLDDYMTFYPYDPNGNRSVGHYDFGYYTEFHRFTRGEREKWKKNT